MLQSNEGSIMGLEGIISSLTSSQIASEVQIKLQKGAMQQDGKIAMQLIESAVSTPLVSGLSETGNRINIFA